MSDAIERLKARQRQSAQGGNVLDAIMQPQAAAQGDIVQIPGGRLHNFGNHTFRLRPMDDPYMQSLMDSIRENGILEPLLVRPHPSIPGDYEIIAGHTRHYLGTQAGLVSFPCIIRELDDADAIIQMGESNVQRPDWLPSEKAMTYRLHLEAVQHKRLNRRTGADFAGKTRDLAAKRWGITGKALEMYIKLTDLDPGLLQLVDEGRIPVKAGGHLASLTSDQQQYLLELLMDHPKVKVSVNTAVELRSRPAETYPRVLGLEGGEKKDRGGWNIVLPRELLPKEAKRYLAEPELQERIANLVREYIARKGKN